MRRNHSLKSYLPLIVAIIILGAILWYVATNWHQFSKLHFTNPWLLIPAVLLIPVNIYSIGALMAVVLEPLGVYLKQNELFGLAGLNRFFNYVAPAYFGAVVRAAYLKKAYSFSFANFTSSFIAANLINFLVAALLVLLTFILHGGNVLDHDSQRLLIIVGAALAFFILLLLVPLGWLQGFTAKLRRKRDNKLTRTADNALSGFIIIRAHKSSFYKMVSWVFVNIVSASFLTLLIYRVLGYHIGFLPALFLTALSNWGQLFSITPGNIGIKEGLMVVAAKIMGVPVPETLAAALLLRLLTFGAAAALASYYAPKLLHTSLAGVGKLNDRSNK